MKINQILLKSATEHIRGLVPKKPLLPYHTYILLQTTENGLEVRYTNNEASFKTILVDGFDGEFDLCIEATLIEALAEVDSMLSFKVVDNRCVVSTKGRRFTLPTMSSESYPMESASNNKIFSVNSAAIRSAIDKCNGFGMTETMHQLVGTRFSYAGSLVEVGASDMNAAVYSFIQTNAEKEFGFTVTTQLCNIVKDLCEKDDIMHVFESNKDVQWQCGLSVLTTRKHSSNTVLKPFYLTLDKIKGIEADKIQISDRKWFIDSLRRSTLFSDSAHTYVTVFLKENEITLNVESDTGKNSEQTIECIYPKSGDAVKIILNYNFLLRLLGKMDEEDVVLNVATEGDPVRTAMHVSEGDVTFLLMPFVT